MEKSLALDKNTQETLDTRKSKMYYRISHPKNKCMSSFTHSQDVLNLNEYLSSVDFEECG